MRPRSSTGSPAAVTAGATFAIATTCTASESVSLAPSESVTLIATWSSRAVREVALEAAAAWRSCVGVPTTSVPPVPQVG